MEWINQLKEKKIQNNIAIRFLFLFFIVLLGFVLTFFLRSSLEPLLKFKDRNFQIKIMALLGNFSILLVSFLFKQLKLKTVFSKISLEKEIFFWSFIYLFGNFFLSAKLSSFIDNSDPAILEKSLFSLFIIVLIGPFFEELFFRGVIFQVFNNNSYLTIILISSILFALAHGAPGIIFLISGSAFYFGYIYVKTKSLWNSIFIHIINNLTGTFLFFTNNILFTQTEGLLFNLLGGVSLIFCFYNFFRMYKFLPSK
ncbi:MULTISPECIES: CPBP family intramembrane glutamic endopeptidase [Psychrilyobacter]|uniref:CPBP family intramembrane metalloprotease n=1 Tax=Psychrilyobacter piezotolerans TaxID=2293438 RepID=A0ABX9KDP8_9FUSO|nr:MULTISPECIES: CPBP family intramembrane glutamic endopeptidase [Psychrilyobacter]MCS5422471.1 CPBP family intramembrane metalloprotease [Psychrilyobacter sp. S5]NDI79013.1 CPBP family intramembrane metalloprotease [Psychrilyobacter piezotolerans]RDE59096.1 CPBP family intramembrane metalloprotease [Psychrilyobacter sp. S5]REI39667.1 CPBP family intramembrane metalloprotease [Psychrilyobacter piezotolerans]